MVKSSKSTKKHIKIDRGTVDKVVSYAGLTVAVGLILLSGALMWAHGFIHSQVAEQLSAQKITFPEEDSPAFKALEQKDQDAIRPFAGQRLETGAGAKAFADHYIAAHLRKSGGGRTYNELSSASRANPGDAELKGLVESSFKGETLRGVLLNAYAFDTMAVVARIIAYCLAAVSLVLVLLAYLGFRHAKKVS